MGDEESSGSVLSAKDIVSDMIDEWHLGAGKGMDIVRYLGVPGLSFAAWVEQRISDEQLIDSAKPNGLLYKVACRRRSN